MSVNTKHSSFKNFLLIDKPTIRVIFALVIPAAIEIAMSSLFGMVDYMMAGKFSTDALNAIGLYATPSNVFVAAFSAVNVGTTTLVAWNIGAGNTKNANRIMKISMLMNFVLGIVVTVVTCFFAPQLIQFMAGNKYGDVNIKGTVASDAVDVFIICTSTQVFQAMTMSITASLRGAGENKIPMFYNFSSNLLNVFGNYIFIYGVKALSIPRMGAQGAALSTAICKVFTFVFAIIYLNFTRRSKLSFKMAREKKDDNEKHGLHGIYRLLADSNVRKILEIGLPAAGESITLQIGLMLFSRVVVSTGPVSYASHQIGNNISGFFTSLCSAFSIASNALMGQSLGAGSKENAKHYVSSICKISVMSSAAIGIVMFLFAGNVVHMYTDDAEIIALSSKLLQIFALTVIALSFQSCISGALRGAGDTKFPLYVVIFCVLFLRVALVTVAVNVLHFNIVAVWFVTLFDQVLRGAIMYKRYRSERWANKLKLENLAEKAQSK